MRDTERAVILVVLATVGGLFFGWSVWAATSGNVREGANNFNLAVAATSFFLVAVALGVRTHSGEWPWHSVLRAVRGRPLAIISGVLATAGGFFPSVVASGGDLRCLLAMAYRRCLSCPLRRSAGAPVGKQLGGAAIALGANIRPSWSSPLAPVLHIHPLQLLLRVALSSALASGSQSGSATRAPATVS